jgi:diguanylate cyclase (GGDEF)-like protein
VSESKPTRTVLIVDDEQSLRDALEMTFSREGYQVLKAAGGCEGLEAARTLLPDVILLDVMMPGMDGYEVCKKLRSHYRTRHIPVILLTAKGTEEDKLEGLQGGANDYVLKPWNKRELVTRVHNHLEWAKNQKAVNPLTGLPGGVSILAERQRRLDEGRPFSQMVLDVDYFKAYNDRYGFARGDIAISRIAETLTRVVDEDAQPENFVGHIGGDDFVVLSSCDAAESIGEEIIEAFNSAAMDLYDEEDRSRGHVDVLNRRHVVERFPLMSLTIAMVSTDRVPVTHLAQLIDIAQELKAHGKGIPGSVVVGERRRRQDPPSAQNQRVA